MLLNGHKKKNLKLATIYLRESENKLMGLFKKKEQNKDNPYLGLRQLALDIKPEDITEKNYLYFAIADKMMYL